MTAFLQGFGLGGGLIVAIGAQNAFVLTQGVRRNYPMAVATVCIVCDGLLIFLGVTGVGSAVGRYPLLGRLAAWGGAAFLAWYGFGAFRSAWKGGVLEQGRNSGKTLRQTLLLTLGVTLLNPHVYLDTVLLMGSVSGQFAIPERYVFGLGALCASIVWFILLSLGGQVLAPVFSRQSTWRFLDGVVCLTMWSLALGLIRSTLST
ncbi:LysE/ArgO family amino acid transporter [Pseudodesulfovibrio piezophilus]|uniref:Putative amino-acid transporter yggA n=1 Tax=Pseudodesulfovibrio piezophilus (strain DSM 21447 / JCM 15486 / C1TLV30) TaxID=1322246 RepID=M1WX56_PSEP2|nr:LysE/ArgO family amino acid transporter [Pseudodesulfovibrio piezophilus]CCH49523.1 putative amino-acid transporter yggA [Pseudodesulfovibrio piezophilus C1TLV30]